MFKKIIYRSLIVAVTLLFASSSRGQYDTTGVVDVEENTNSYQFKQIDPADTSIISERHIPPEQVSKLKKDKAFWYADKEAEKEKVKDPQKGNTPVYTPLGQRTWVQTLLWVLIVAAFAAALIWYLASNQVNLFRRRREIPQEMLEDEEMPEDIFAINYQREIDKAAAQGNFRLAVRLLYLKLLKLLADRQYIRYKHDLTNFDYLMQLQPSKYYQHFFRLTRHYEYSWYGHFDVDESQYRQIRTDFDKMDREVQQ